MESVSNARPLSILAAYLTTAAILTAFCISIILKRPGSGNGGAARLPEASHRRAAIAGFSILAALSLATTWYHMFRFFQWSYVQWASSQADLDATSLHLGQWLRDTTLFKQAWASTLETPPRAWWSTQIFGFCANWSVMLAAQGWKRRIPHLWAFMLLGQIVAISFASNLSFLAFIVYQRSDHSGKTPKGGAENGTLRPKSEASGLLALRFWWTASIAICVAVAIAIPDAFGHPHFMKLLLIPHTLAFAPLVLNKVLAADAASEMRDHPTLIIQFGAMAALLVTASLRVINEGSSWETILSTLHEHPAVSSVGWDVICCWASFAAWNLWGDDG